MLLLLLRLLWGGRHPTATPRHKRLGSRVQPACARARRRRRAVPHWPAVHAWKGSRNQLRLGTSPLPGRHWRLHLRRSGRMHMRQPLALGRGWALLLRHGLAALHGHHHWPLALLHHELAHVHGHQAAHEGGPHQERPWHAAGPLGLHGQRAPAAHRSLQAGTWSTESLLCSKASEKEATWHRQVSRPGSHHAACKKAAGPGRRKFFGEAHTLQAPLTSAACRRQERCMSWGQPWSYVKDRVYV